MKRSLLRLTFVVLAALSFVSCTQPATPVDTRVAEDIAKLEPQPPVLPIEAVTTPLPALRGTVKVTTGLRTQAIAASGRVEMRLLVLSPTVTDPGLEAAKTFIDQVGIPYEVLIASTDNLSEAKLVNANGDGRYQGIILTDGALAFNGGSALSADEWNLLWAYERDHKVRQVSLYTFPGTYPEDYGIGFTAAQDTTNANYPIKLTSAGESVFSSLKSGVSIPVRYAYTYLANLDGSFGTTATPLLTDNSGNIVAVTSTSTDGRERMALTMAHNPYLLHSQLLGYDVLRWVTQGVFFGEKQYYLGLDEDDWFTATDKWDASVGRINGTYRLTAGDAHASAAQQAKLVRDYSVVRNSSYPFAYAMAYNATSSNPNAYYSCDRNVRSVDPLSSATKCLQSKFYWVNHTWSHEYMDAPLSYGDAYNQIYWNQYASYYWFGLDRYGRGDYSTLVTGDISGLGWYNPNGPDGAGGKVDFGLEASNQNFLRAARARGVRYIASNMSVKSHEPDCWGCGIYHPLEPSILLIPRWPTNVFYSVTTPTDAMDAYNKVYGPAGSAPFFDRDQTYSEFLNFETDIALYHMLTGTPYPHYQHVGNLREYAPGKSLSYDWTDALLNKYSAYYNLPVLSLSWRDLSLRVTYRTSFMNANVKGIWDRNTGRITVTTGNSGWVYLTGARYGSSWQYGSATVSRFYVSRGQQLTLSALPGATSLSTAATDGLLAAEPFDVAPDAASAKALNFELTGEPEFSSGAHSH